jgi:hypothetical protein
LWKSSREAVKQFAKYQNLVYTIFVVCADVRNEDDFYYKEGYKQWHY